jgi:CubicO group peptidase (beta-lactamase class C family)
MPDLLSRLLWAPLAETDMDAGVDRGGAVFHDGGLAATLRDLARFGEMLRRDGGDQNRIGMVPPGWIADSLSGGPDSRQAFADSPTDTGMPGGMYRNQFWIPYSDRGVLLCLGIHGQMVYVDLDNAAVVVKFSSWPVPFDADCAYDTLAAVEALVAALH